MEQVYRYSLCVLIVFGIVCFALAQEEWMPDSNLQQAVREKLGVSAKIPLREADIQRLRSLVVLNSDIANLQGLEHANNLKFLHLGNSRVSDLSPLRSLLSLSTLKLYGNEIVNVSPLSELVNLRVLTLERNRIVDISPFSGLINLEVLHLQDNQIQDWTPLLGLKNLKVLRVENNPIVSLTLLEELNILTENICHIQQLPVTERIENREYPSVFGAWGNIINLPGTAYQRRTKHDLFFHAPMFGLHYAQTNTGTIKLVGDIQTAIEQREAMLAQNPNFVYLVPVAYFTGVWIHEYSEDLFPEDLPLRPIFHRDAAGNKIEKWGAYVFDFTFPETQAWALAHVKAIAECGLFDGIFLDHWNEYQRLSPNRTREQEHAARDKLLRDIRANVPDDFLIMVNTNHAKIPRWAGYVNGTFMETRGTTSTDSNQFLKYHGYPHAKLAKIESTLLWSEENFRQPIINGLEGTGLTDELPDSTRNRQWMRLFTTLSLTHSDGYVLYNLGIVGLQHEHPWNNPFLAQTFGHLNQVPHNHGHAHYWYDFYDADLGRPVGGNETKGQSYDNHDGIFIREFTNG